jgi:hypothetical protein
MKNFFTISYFILLVWFLLKIIFLPAFAQTTNPISLQKTNLDFHYEPVEGKFIGLWPPWTYYTAETLAGIRLHWGFSGVLVHSEGFTRNYIDYQYKNAIAAGYSLDKIMVKFWDDDNFNWAVDSLPAGFYYLGEPVEHDCAGHPSNSAVPKLSNPQELSEWYNYILQIRPNAKFVIDGYKRCSHLRIAGNYADVVMYSSYQNWNSLFLPVCNVNLGWGDQYEAGWAPGSGLQSDSWNNMRSIFGGRFSMSWMNAGADEYFELFHEANNLGLTAIWLYALEGLDESKLAAFCDAAWQRGWLRKVENTPVSAPTNLNAQALPTGFISLSWKDNSDNESVFTIERKSALEESFTGIAFVLADETSFTDYSATYNSTYYYRVKAANYYNESDYSNEVQINSYSVPAKTQLLQPPDNSELETASVTFIWQSVEFVQTYTLQVSEDSLFNNLIIHEDNIPDAFFTNHTLELSKRYFWRVKANNFLGDGDFSDTWSFRVIDSNVNYTITGNIIYDNSSGSPFYNAKVTLKKLSSGNQTVNSTNAWGNFTKLNVDAGLYTLSVSYNGMWGGVNAADALAVARYYVGLVELDDLQLLAADVSNNKIINNGDALLIVQRYVELIDSFSDGKDDWVFYPQIDTIEVNDNMSFSFKGLAAGDVNKSHIFNPQLTKVIPDQTVMLIPSDKIQTSTGEKFTVPVKLNINEEIGSISLTLKYPASIVKFSGLKSNYDFLYKTDEASGKIIIAWADLSGGLKPIRSDINKILFELEFTALSEGNFYLMPDPSSQITDAEGNLITMELFYPEAGIKAAYNFRLFQNQPNPFNASTKIKFQIHETAPVKLTIYDVLGTLVEVLLSEEKEAGEYEVNFNRANLPSGVYFYRLTSGGQSSIQKMILLR